MSVFGGLERDLAEAASRGFVSQRRYAGQLRYRRKRLLSALSGLLLIAFGSGCLRSGVTHQHFVNNYKTVAASASADHYTPYWLGYGFSAAGVQFKGPGTGDFAYVVPGGGVIAEYAPESGAGLLTLTCYSPKAWAMWQAQNPHANDAASELSVKVGSMSGTLVRIPSNGRPNYFAVVFQLGETTVVASTLVDSAHPSATPNPNPLVDVQTLISVLSKLRPYPQ